jgi:hypothetical protein
MLSFFLVIGKIVWIVLVCYAGIRWLSRDVTGLNFESVNAMKGIIAFTVLVILNFYSFFNNLPIGLVFGTSWDRIFIVVLHIPLAIESYRLLLKL